MVDPQVAMVFNTTVCSDLDDLEYQNDGIMYPIHFHQCFQFNGDLSSFETIPNILPVAGNHEKKNRKPRPSRDLFAPRDFHQTMAAPLSSLALLGL